MSAQQRIKRLAFTRPFLANGTVSFPDLPRNYDNECYVIRIRGTATLPVALPAGSNTFKPALRSDAPAGLIPRVELILEGRNTVVSAPWSTLNRQNVWRRRGFYAPTVPDSFGPTQDPGLVRNVATASTALVENTAITFESTIFIDNAMMNGIRPKDTNLKTGGLQTLELRLTTADSAALFYQPVATLLTTPFAAPAVGASLAATLGTVVPLTNVNIDVFIVELQEMILPGGAMTLPGFLRRFSSLSVPISAANSNLEIQIPTDNFIQALLVSSHIGGERVDGIINNIKLRRGNDVRYDLPIRDIIALNDRDYDHPRFPGTYAIDLMAMGARADKITDAWNVQGGSDVRLVLDVANPGANVLVDVTTAELLPLRAA